MAECEAKGLRDYVDCMDDDVEDAATCRMIGDLTTMECIRRFREDGAYLLGYAKAKNDKLPEHLCKQFGEIAATEYRMAQKEDREALVKAAETAGFDNCMKTEVPPENQEALADRAATLAKQNRAGPGVTVGSCQYRDAYSAVFEKCMFGESGKSTSDCEKLAETIALQEGDGYPLDYEYHEYMANLRDMSRNPRVSWWMRKATGIIAKAMSKQHHRVRVIPEVTGGFPAPGVSGQ